MAEINLYAGSISLVTVIEIWNCIKMHGLSITFRFMFITAEILAADMRALNEFFQRIVGKFRAPIRKTGNVD